MDLRQLAALVAVAETGTFSAAADLLHTVQSNVSTHVARLERELGVTLVDRSAGRLTQEGEAVVARARRVQAELDALAADVASLRDEVLGRVRLGVIGTTGRWLMPHLLDVTRERHPKVTIEVLDGNTTTLVPQLLAGGLDLAVLNLPVDEPDLEIEDLFDEELVVIAPQHHPLAGHDEVTLAELGETELLLTPAGTAFRDDLDQVASAAGVTLRPLFEIDGLRLIASLAFDGFGPAILPASAIPAWLVGGSWSRVAIAGIPRRQVGLARRRRGLLSAPARALRDVLLDVIAERSGDQPGVRPAVPVRT